MVFKFEQMDSDTWTFTGTTVENDEGWAIPASVRRGVMTVEWPHGNNSYLTVKELWVISE